MTKLLEQKVVLLSYMLNETKTTMHDVAIEASESNCPSASYFIDTIHEDINNLEDICDNINNVKKEILICPLK